MRVTPYLFTLYPEEAAMLPEKGRSEFVRRAIRLLAGGNAPPAPPSESKAWPQRRFMPDFHPGRLAEAHKRGKPPRHREYPCLDGVTAWAYERYLKAWRYETPPPSPLEWVERYGSPVMPLPEHVEPVTVEPVTVEPVTVEQGQSGNPPPPEGVGRVAGLSAVDL